MKRIIQYIIKYVIYAIIFSGDNKPDIKINLSEERIAELETLATAQGKSINQYVPDAVKFAAAVDEHKSVTGENHHESGE